MAVRKQLKSPNMCQPRWAVKAVDRPEFLPTGATFQGRHVVTHRNQGAVTPLVSEANVTSGGADPWTCAAVVKNVTSAGLGLSGESRWVDALKAGS